MKKTIEKIREKPEKERRRIAFGTSLAITLIIFTFWFSSMNAGFFHNSTVASETERAEDDYIRDNLASPLASIRESISGLWSGIPLFIEGFRKEQESGDLEIVEEDNAARERYQSDIYYSLEEGESDFE